MADHSRILIVDDEPNIRFVLRRALEKDKHAIDEATDGRDAVAKIARGAYDLIVLDLQMQPVGGIEVLKAVKAYDPDTFVIILTAHSTVESAVDALRLGAFDYLFKPVMPDALRKRVREALQERQETLHRAQVLKQVDTLRATLLDLQPETPARKSAKSDAGVRASADLKIDPRQRLARLRGRPLDLTTAEFNVLACLVQRAPQPISPRELLNQALEYDAGEAEAAEIIKFHIHHLRKKIEDDPLHPRFIKTVRYKGYLWSGE